MRICEEHQVLNPDAPLVGKTLCWICKRGYKASHDARRFGSFIGRLKYLLNECRKRKASDINIDDLLELLEAQSNRCALTGRELTTKNISIDRINSALGYLKNNIQLVTKQANLGKQLYTNKEFIDMCQDVVNFAQQSNARQSLHPATVNPSLLACPISQQGWVESLFRKTYG